MATNNIVLVHGLWMTPLSFEYWAHHFTELGYRVHAPGWPGMERDMAKLMAWLGKSGATPSGSPVSITHRPPAPLSTMSSGSRSVYAAARSATVVPPTIATVIGIMG